MNNVFEDDILKGYSGIVTDDNQLNYVRWKWIRINRIVFDFKYNGNGIYAPYNLDFNAKEIYFQYQKWKLTKE